MMNLKDLKSAVLKYAFEGKLTTKQKDDISIIKALDSFLLKNDAVSKSKKELKIKNKLGRIYRNNDSFFEEINNQKVCIDEQIKSSIPEHWEWVRFGNILDIKGGFTPSTYNSLFWTNATIPWFTVHDIHDQGELIYKTKKLINEVCVSKERIIPKNSVLLCCTASIGESAINKIELTTNQQFNALIPKDRSIIDYKYLFYFTKTLKQKLLALAGKTTISFFSVTKLNQILIPLPPLAEQQRIVAKLDQIIPWINEQLTYENDLINNDNSLVKELKKSILDLAFKGKIINQEPNDGSVNDLVQQIEQEQLKLIKDKKIKPSQKVGKITQKNNSFYEIIDKKEVCIDDQIPFQIPANWTWIRLGNVSNLFNGNTVNVEMKNSTQKQ